jgi:ABC-2 type transport system permease protein
VSVTPTEQRREAYHRETRAPSVLDDQHLLNEPEVVERSRRPGPIQRLRNVWQYRELLRNLVRTQLKVKYKNSVLGFLWTLLNPVLYLVVFTVVFDLILTTSIEVFPVYLLSGLLAWNLFSTALGDGATSIVNNASLVNRVWFPREILPLAAIGAALVHFFLQMLVLFGALLLFQRAPGWEYLPALLMAMVVLLLLCAAFAIVLAAVNVYLRDTGHLLELALVAWFWCSAIVYPYLQIADKLEDKLAGGSTWLLLNPMMPVITTFQRVIYNPADAEQVLQTDTGIGWYFRNLTVVGTGAVIGLVLALYVFGRLEDNFAEEI